MTTNAALLPPAAPNATWRDRLLVPVLLSTGMLVAVVSSLGSPMVPTVARDYGVTLGAAQWTLTVTLLSGAVITPLLGRLGDGRYRRQVILGAIATVLVGSALAAIPTTFAVLLIGRACQGVGLGLMPLAMSIARTHLPAAKVPGTIAALSVTTAAGVGVGYPISGLLADSLGFHPTFLFAVAGAAIVLTGSALAIPDERHLHHQPVDLAGAVALAVGLALLVVGLSEATSWGVTSPRFAGVLAFAVVTLAGWVIRELREAHPLIDLRSLHHPAVRTAQAAALFAGVGMYLLLSLVIRYVQTPASTGYGQGRTVLVAGLLLVPFSAASFSANRLQPTLRRLAGERWLMPGGCLVLVVAMVLFGTARSELWQLSVETALAGVGVGIVFAAMPQMIIPAIPRGETGSALGFNQVLRTVGGAVGSAVSGSLLAAHLLPDGHYPTDHAYTLAAFVAIGVWVATALLCWPYRRAPTAPAPVPFLAITEAVDGEVAGALIFEVDDESEQTQP